MEMTGQPHALTALTRQEQLSANSSRGRVGEFGTNYRGSTGRKGSGASLYCICFCLSRQCNYLPTVPMNPLTPSQSHSADDSQSGRFSVKIINSPTLAGAPNRPSVCVEQKGPVAPRACLGNLVPGYEALTFQPVA
jgi:hypothetical protein